MTALTKYDWVNDPTGTLSAGSDPSYRVGSAPRSTTPRYSGNATTDWLTWVSSKVINAVATTDARQLPCAADLEPIPLIYGEDRIGGKILNVVPHEASGIRYVLVQVLWAHECDSMPAEPEYNDEALPAGSLHEFYRGNQSSPSTLFKTAIEAAGVASYTDYFPGFAYSVIGLPVNSFTGSLKFTAVLRGRRVYDPRQDAASNRLMNSEAFDQASWAKNDATITANAAVAPDGTTTADKLVESATTAAHHVISGIASSSGTYTASIYVKAVERSRGWFYMTDALTGNAIAVFDLGAGTASVFADGSWTGASCAISAVGNGWYRVSVTATQGAGTAVYAALLLADGSGNTNYLGDGTSGLLCWGAQIKAGAVPGTYNRTGPALGTQVLATPSTWVYSDNPSLCDADFLASEQYGCKKLVNWDSVIGAANANDELVGSAKRRTLNVTFEGELAAPAVAETLRAYAGCFHVPGDAGIKLVPDRPYTGTIAQYSHDAGNIAAIQLQKKDVGNVPTVCELRYTDRTSVPWRDLPVVVPVIGVDTLYPRRTTKISMPGINTKSQATREATERLNKLRTNDLSIVIDVFDIGIQHEVGDVISVLCPPVGLTVAKLFRISGDPEMIGNNLWRLSGSEYDAGAYSNDVVAEGTTPDTGLTNPLTPPPAVASITYSFSSNGIELQWPRSTWLTVTEYELRKGAGNWTAASSLLGGTQTLSAANRLTWPPQAAGTHRVQIKARTSVGVESPDPATYVDVVVAAPVLNSLDIAIVGGDYKLTWTLQSTSQPIAFYRVKRNGTVVAEVLSDQFQAEVDWSGNMPFTVAGVDIAGNEGAALATSLSIDAPLAVASFTSTSIVNTVIFNWTPPAFSPLPIVAYEMKRGALGSTWNSAVSIGSKAGDQSFTTWNESETGEFDFWIAAVDSAGNEGIPTKRTVKVSAPANFKLTDKWDSTFSGTKTNAVLADNGSLYAPVNTTETFHEHFQVNNGPWASPQDQINAGYPLYIQPSVASGSYVEVFTPSALVNAALVSIVPSGGWVGGANGTLTPTIEVSSDNFVSDIRNLGNVWEAYASNFTKIRVTLTWGASAGDDVYELTALSVRLALQTEIDSGNVASTGPQWSAGVCTVNFTKDFVDVDSITITVNSTARREYAYEFTDIANPILFYVRIWDPVSGVLTPTAFSWQATGVV